MLFPKGKHFLLWPKGYIFEIHSSPQHFLNILLLSVWWKRLSLLLNIAFDWHYIMLTVMPLGCFFFFLAALWAQQFFCPYISCNSLPHFHFRSLFYLHISAMSGVSKEEQREEGSFSYWALRVISSHVLNPLLPTLLLLLHFSSLSGALICASLLSGWRMLLWRQHQTTCWPPACRHRTATC